MSLIVSQGLQRGSERAGDRAHNRPDASGNDMDGDPGNLGHGDSASKYCCENVQKPCGHV